MPHSLNSVFEGQARSRGKCLPWQKKVQSRSSGTLQDRKESWGQPLNYNLRIQFLQFKKTIKTQLALGDALAFSKGKLGSALKLQFNGQFYRDYWSMASEFVDALQPFLFITSFNEWHEGSEMEPAAGRVSP
jgi:hypothetical protein